MNIIIEELIIKAAQDKIQKLSVGAAILHNDRILILKRRSDDFMPNIYELPGGGLEKGETLLDAVKREITEETNCSIDTFIKYIGHIDFMSASDLLTRRFNFLVTPKLPFSIILSEHADYCWIERSDAINYNITPQTQKIIASV